MGNVREKIIVGSRRSRLAILQAEEVISQLKQYYPQFRFEIKKIKTSADRDKDLFFDRFYTQGIFTKEIEDALLEGEIDLAVHSLKDVPTKLPQGLSIAAVPKRRSFQDALILSKESLPTRAKVGTSSIRRKAQLLRWRKDLEVVPIRGNIETRIKRLRQNQYDAIVVSLAALERLKIKDLEYQPLGLDVMLPAPGQGALGIEVREKDEEIKEMVKRINDLDSYLAVQAEREFLKALGGGCRVPIAGIGVVEGDQLYLRGAVFSLDGRQFFSRQISGRKEESARLGIQLAESLILERG